MEYFYDIGVMFFLSFITMVGCMSTYGILKIALMLEKAMNPHYKTLMDLEKAVREMKKDLKDLNKGDKDELDKCRK